MLTGLLILSTVLLLAVLSHRRSRLENKIYKNVPLEDWLNSFVFPTAFYTGWFFVMRSIVSRPPVNILPFDDIDLLAITFLFMAYGFLGNGIHFTSKILWKLLQSNHNTMAYKVNEMFHGKLSHYLVYLNGLFIVYLLAIIEINHPLNYPVASDYQNLIFILGLVFGFGASKSIFFTNEWFGGYNKPLSTVCLLLLCFLLLLGKNFNIRYSVYPVSLFVAVMGFSFVFSFLIRQFFIFIRLGNKRKLRFLAKIFSVA